MSEHIQPLLSELKASLEAMYGHNLKGLYLFGSYARGEEDNKSDVDVIIVLANFDRYGAELDRTSHLVSNLSLKHNVSISTIFVQERDWLEADTPLLRNVREEAVAA